MMGSGKSKIGQAVATRSGQPFLDTGLLVEDAAVAVLVETLWNAY